MSEATGARVWVRDPRRAWVRGVVEKREQMPDGKWKFTVQKEPIEEDVDSEDDMSDAGDPMDAEETVEIVGDSMELSEHADLFLCNQFEDNRTLADVADLTWLTHLHEPSILQSLYERFKRDHIYTNTGPILLAVNPFKQIKLYTPELLEMYYSTGLLRSQGLEAPQMPPHVYATGDAAYRNLVDTMDSSSKNQSILVSGESGAGKTESTKFIMQYLATVARDDAAQDGQKIADMVLQSNPILEAFGNARTNRNDNSSRFGKFIEMQFNAKGHLVGARIVTYLLEKVRLAKQGLGERNFHVFYQLCRGATPEQLEEWHVPDLEESGITNQSECYDRKDGVDDDSQFERMWKAMETMGFPEEEKIELMRTVAAVMNLGNLAFVPDAAGSAGDEDEAAVMDRDNEASNKALKGCTELIKVEEEALIKALTTRRIKVGVDWISKRLSVDEAADARDALLKTIYSRMFDRVVKRVNESIQVSSKIKTNCIGVLDIFGFEVFEYNSFEQLCINYANETLQQQFNQFVFKLEQKEYEKEKIKWSFIDFPDNQKCLDLIEAKPIGIISLLDEQCLFPKGNDKSLASKFYELLEGVPRFSASNKDKVNFKFTVEHYAGNVTYDTAGFVAKNKDQLYQESLELMQTSQDKFLSLLFPKNEGNDAAAAKKGQSGRSIQSKTLGSQFKEQLADLLKTIRSTSPHYVRCLKPNDRAAANVLVRQRLVDQLRYGGVLEAVKVARAGYPVRMVLANFVSRYFMLAGEKININKARNDQDGKPATLKIVKALDLEPESEFQIGRTKIFLRKGAYERIEDARLTAMKVAATRIQSVARATKDLKHYRTVIRAVRKLQAVSRGMMGRSEARFVRNTRAATKIQCNVRRFLAIRKRLQTVRALVTIQCAYRSYKSRMLAKELKRDISILRMQAWYRGLPARRAFMQKRTKIILMQKLVRRALARIMLKRLREEARQVGNLQGKISELHARVKALESELEEEKQAHEALKKASAVSEADADLAVDLAQAKSHIEELEAEISRLKTAAERATAEAEAAKAEAETFKAEVESAKAEVESAKAEVESAKAEAAAATAAAATAAAAASASTAANPAPTSPAETNAVESADMAALQARCDAQAKEIEALRAQFARQASSPAAAPVALVQKSQSDIEMYEDKEGEESLLHSDASRGGKANEQEGDLGAEQAAEIRRLREQVSQLESDLVDARESAAAGVAAATAAAAARASGDQDSLTTFQEEEIQRLNHQLITLQKQLAESNEMTSHVLDESFAAADAASHNDEADTTPPDARVEIMQREISDLEEEKTMLIDQLREFTEKMMDAENRANSYQNETAKFRNSNRDLMEKLKSMETLSEQASSVKIKLARRLEGLILENRTLRQEMNEAEERVAKLEQENRLLMARR